MEASNNAYGDVKQMMRKIAKGFPDENKGVDSVYAVDTELDDWYKKGYKLVNSFYLGQTEDAYNFFYILAKR